MAKTLRMPKTKREFMAYLVRGLLNPKKPTGLKYGMYLILGQCLGFVSGDLNVSEVTSAKANMFDTRIV